MVFIDSKSPVNLGSANLTTLVHEKKEHNSKDSPFNMLLEIKWDRLYYGKVLSANVYHSLL